MHFKTSKILFTVVSAIFLFVNVSGAANKELSIVSVTGSNTLTVTEGDPITLLVKVDDASQIAGASFKITYDNANLSLTGVTSTFFDTFVNQSIPTPNDQGYVTVDGTDYSSPLVSNTISGGSMLAAARLDNGMGTDVTLFTLSFELTGDTGNYLISITQSVINNTAAGYDADGEVIPFLIGIDDDSYVNHDVNIINSCSLTVSAPFIDTDGDGIDDNWEIDNFGDITTADAESDYDKDGYTDYQEYLNRNEVDPSGASYNPKVKNAPGGTGYVPLNGFLPSIYNLLLL